MTAPLEPTTAERLARLRILLNDAQSRAGDTSVLGQHLAVIALDAVGELAIGLCLHERSLEHPGGVPRAVKRLRTDLGMEWQGLGRQGFDELHRARNLAQHQGVLPAADQLGRWAAETETFVRDLVSTVYGVELREVSSALGISNPELRDLLHQADHTLDAGDPETSFELSWNALEAARRAWSASGGGARIPSSGTSTGFEEFREIDSAISDLAERFEISTFTSDVSEWVWMREQHAESMTRSPPTLDDARRALAFVTSWVLRFESYSARYPAERWREWREAQVAPRTGLPGTGPRIRDATLQEPNRQHPDKAYWRFQLADLPASDGEYMTAVSSASYESDEDPTRVTMSLGLRGQLLAVAPTDLSEEQVLAKVHSGLRRATEILAKRRHSEAEQTARAEQVAAAYREVFATAAAQGAPFAEVSVSLREERHDSQASPMVSVALIGDAVAELDYWNALAEVMAEIGLDPAGQGFTAFSESLNFPSSWSPEQAVEWATKGLARAQQRRGEYEATQAEERRLREAAIARMRNLIGEESA
jgi:hypothetical protein